MDFRDSLLSSYDYELNPKLIAQVPVEPRHSARLLMVEDASINYLASKHLKVWDLQEELLPGDLLVVNDTRVVKARVRVIRSGGGYAELLLLEPCGEGNWLCLARPAKRLRPGDILFLEADKQTSIQLKVICNHEIKGGKIVQFPKQYVDRETIEGLLDVYGEVPLPPYIDNQESVEPDRYQTRYAFRPGAVAAPTAGLHLSDELLQIFNSRGVELVRVTLHIGIGTFRPLDQESLEDLKLHSEWVEVTEEVVDAIQACRLRGGRVIAVGTTSVRALEGAFLAGEKCLKPFQGDVDLVIKPGYKFGVVDALLTNFHLPKSSLLLLVSALIGRERLLALYAEAIERQYRFFSYGDAMWISPKAVLPDARFQLSDGS